MSATQFDVIAIGNAIVDVMAPCDDALIERLGMTRGGMTLIDTLIEAVPSLVPGGLLVAASRRRQAGRMAGQAAS